MVDLALIREAGLTDGEAKVYLALLRLGSTTTGPIADASGVANSVIYRILSSLIDKGLCSYVIKEKTKHFQAAEPRRILDYIDERKERLEQNKGDIAKVLPQLTALMTLNAESSVRLFEGFKGLQTAWETCYSKLKRGEDYHCWGIYPVQEERFHLYWQRDHVRREKMGIRGKILFNKGTDPSILQQRNSYPLIDARYMPTDIQTPSWFVVFKDVTMLFLQKKSPLVVQIINQEIADSFEAYFQDLWKKTVPFKGKK